jgi:hypothetical protein
MVLECNVLVERVEEQTHELRALPDPAPKSETPPDPVGSEGV